MMEIIYPVSHPIVDRDFLAKYSRVACITRAEGSCRTGPPADRNVLKTFDRMCPTIGWESVYIPEMAEALRLAVLIKLPADIVVGQDAVDDRLDALDDVLPHDPDEELDEAGGEG